MADVKFSYPSSTTVTISLASLASDTNLLAGRQSTEIDNTTNKYLDYLLSGKIRVNTTVAPTTNRAIQVFVVAITDGTTYPDQFTGSDANRSVTSANQKNQICRFAAEMVIDATTGVTYWFSGVSVAAIFGGVLPTKFVVWVVHNTGQTLSTTSGDHVISIQPVFQTVT